MARASSKRFGKVDSVFDDSFLIVPDAHNDDTKLTDLVQCYSRRFQPDLSFPLPARENLRSYLREGDGIEYYIAEDGSIDYALLVAPHVEESGRYFGIVDQISGYAIELSEAWLPEFEGQRVVLTTKSVAHLLPQTPEMATIRASNDVVPMLYALDLLIGTRIACGVERGVGGLYFATNVQRMPREEAKFIGSVMSAGFDFDWLTDTDAISSNNAIPITRNTDQISHHWISSDADIGHRMIALSAYSSEYKEIHDIVQLSNTAGRQVASIQRIENRPLYRQYLIQKDKVTKSCPIGHVVERDLFHGTKKEHLDGICSDGFDRSRAGQTYGAVYGAGSYFSTTFAYSASCAPEGHVLFCKVLVGESVQGSHGLSVLPYKPGFPGIKHDSAVDNLQNPSQFVIFADTNAYPAYLITLANGS